MPLLAAHAQAHLGPYPTGARLRIDLPLTNNAYEWPRLNGTLIRLNAFRPQIVTLGANTVYILTAGTVQITYTIL